MTGWLVPSILGVVLVGILVGLLVSRQVFKVKIENIPFWGRHRILTADVPAGASHSQMTGTAESQAVENRPVERKTVPKIPKDDRIEVYLNTRKNSSAVKTPLSPALLELQNNLSIATTPITNNLTNFQLEIWNTRRSEFNVVTPELMQELTEAYVDMMLANNIVWLVTELGRDSQDLKESYVKLSNKVAERLKRIVPEVRNCFK
jgi:hypothetical protein